MQPVIVFIVEGSMIGNGLAMNTHIYKGHNSCNIMDYMYIIYLIKHIHFNIIIPILFNYLIEQKYFIATCTIYHLLQDCLLLVHALFSLVLPASIVKIKIHNTCSTQLPGIPPDLLPSQALPQNIRLSANSQQLLILTPAAYMTPPLAKHSV